MELRDCEDETESERRDSTDGWKMYFRAKRECCGGLLHDEDGF